MRAIAHMEYSKSVGYSHILKCHEILTTIIALEYSISIIGFSIIFRYHHIYHYFYPFFEYLLAFFPIFKLSRLSLNQVNAYKYMFTTNILKFIIKK